MNELDIHQYPTSNEAVMQFKFLKWIAEFTSTGTGLIAGKEFVQGSKVTAIIFTGISLFEGFMATKAAHSEYAAIDRQQVTTGAGQQG